MVNFLDELVDPCSTEGKSVHWKLSSTFHYCSQLYAAVNKDYDGLLYSHHIRMVAATAIRHMGNIPMDIKITILQACFGHDLIEDARVSYGDLKKKYGELVADIVFAVTDYTGKTRVDRACYDKTRKQKYATFVKMCDRYSNGSYSKLTGSRMYKVYMEEYPKFRASLFVPHHEGGELEESLWKELDQLFEFGAVSIDLYSDV